MSWGRVLGPAFYGIRIAKVCWGGVWGRLFSELELQKCLGGVPGSQIWGGLGSQPKKYWFSFKIYYEILIFLLWATDLDLWGGGVSGSLQKLYMEFEIHI